jgi:hypothetical protein
MVSFRSVATNCGSISSGSKPSSDLVVLKSPVAGLSKLFWMACRKTLMNPEPGMVWILMVCSCSWMLA